MNDIARFEVIDQNGRRLVLNDVTNVRLDYQDDGRTLKVFLRDNEKTRALRRLADELTREYLDESYTLFGPPGEENE